MSGDEPGAPRDASRWGGWGRLALLMAIRLLLRYLEWRTRDRPACGERMDKLTRPYGHTCLNRGCPAFRCNRVAAVVASRTGGDDLAIGLSGLGIILVLAGALLMMLLHDVMHRFGLAKHDAVTHYRYLRATEGRE